MILARGVSPAAEILARRPTAGAALPGNDGLVAAVTGSTEGADAATWTAATWTGGREAGASRAGSCRTGADADIIRPCQAGKAAEGKHRP